MKNNQRKNKKALVLVAMILMIGLVAGMGAMTYSKYATSGTTGTQQATAAQWGFVVTADTTNLFVSDYKSNNTASATYNGSGTVVVNGTGNALVVAPNTKGSMSFSINGSAEVRAKLTIKANEVDTGVKVKDISYGTYHPVVWTLNDGASDVKTGTLAEVVAYLEGTSTTFEPGTPYSKNYTLTWEWAFETTDGSGLNGSNRNVEDSLIGYKVNGKTYAQIAGTFIGEYPLPAAATDPVSEVETNYGTISTVIAFNLSISVEQVQA